MKEINVNTVDNKFQITATTKKNLLNALCEMPDTNIITFNFEKNKAILTYLTDGEIKEANKAMNLINEQMKNEASITPYDCMELPF